MIAKPTTPLRWLCLALLLPLLAACTSDEGPDRGPLVLAASSLQEALVEVAGVWAAEGHVPPVLSFAATSQLARQVEHGAPADLFVSADEEWMDTLAAEKRLRAGTRRDLLGNRLVLVAKRGGTVRSLAALGDGRLAIADPNGVPAGKYAKAALESLGRWESVADKAVPAESVRAALALVERGEAPLGIVYATDAMASDEVEVVEVLPDASDAPIRYPVAMLAASEHPDAAGFLAFLSSPDATRIFEKHGFEIPE